MSFYYLFIPTWIFTILLYTYLAGRYGAKGKYPTEEAKEAVRNKKIKAYQEHKAKQEPKSIRDTSLFSNILKGVAILALLMTLTLAGNVLLGSQDTSLCSESGDLLFLWIFVHPNLFPDGLLGHEKG